MEAHLVNGAFVFGEQLVLLISRGLPQVPGDHRSIGCSCGQQVLLHLVPHNIRTAEVEGRFAANAQIQLLHELLLLQGIDLEDVAPCHHHLRGITAHADGVGGSVQVAEHSSATDGTAAEGRGNP